MVSSSAGEPAKASPAAHAPASSRSPAPRPGEPSARSLRALVNTLEGGFLALLVITAGIGGLWASFWHGASSEAVRINTLLSGAQSLRGDVYRGVKEVTRAQLQQDPDALDKYWRLLYGIDFSFNGLEQNATEAPEREAITDMREAYARMQTAMNRVFADASDVTEQARTEELDPAYQRWILGDFETAFLALNAAIIEERQQLEQRLARFNRLAPMLISIPIAIGLGLLLWTRRRFRRHFVGPMEAIRQGAATMREGELDTQIDADDAVRELRELSLTLNDMAQELIASRDALVTQERQAALGALVPVVAHNIRNPLASIRAAVQVVDVSDTEEWHEVRDEVIATVDRLGRWVNSLLSYLHPLRPHPVACTLPQLTHGAMAPCEARAAEKGVALEVSHADAQGSLTVDVDLMEQALHGLINNAIEASPRGATVRIDTRLAGDDAQLAVLDSGPGFTPQTEPEQLRPGPTTKRRGTGLGIPFAYKVIRGHGGRLAFSQREEGGTRALVELPREITNVEEPSP
ncbi:MAG: ATP-binding protein [Pseudomonadota bacterium]